MGFWGHGVLESMLHHSKAPNFINPPLHHSNNPLIHLMPTIPPHIIDEVRYATDIVSVVSDYVTLKKSGRNFVGLCPFHAEKTPSFSVNAEKQIFHCFGCGVGGSAFAFVQKIEGVSFPEAVRALAKRAGVAIPEPEPEDRAAAQEKETLYFVNQLAADFFQQTLWSEEGKIGREYLQRRGFNDEALQAFHVGFAPSGWEGLVGYARAKAVNLDTLVQAGLINPREKDGKASGYYDRFRNRIMFPIHNLSDRVVAFGGRRIIDDDSPKYINSPETTVYQKGHLLYAFTKARDTLRSADRLIIVEGYLDVMRMHVCGFTNTVSTSGTALTEHQARLVLRYTKNVTLLFDSDVAGSSATLRGADIMVENGLQVRVAAVTVGDDPDSYLLKNPAADMQRILDEAPPLLDFKMRSAASGTVSSEKLEQNRTEQLRSIIDTLARVNDGLERQALVHRMAEQMRVDEGVLWEEIGRLRRSRASRSRNLRHPVSESRASGMQPNLNAFATAESHMTTYGRLVELELIRIMVLHWEAIRFIFSFMRLEDFHDPETHAFAEIFYGFLDREIPLEPEDLLHYFHDPKQAEFVSAIINVEGKRTIERDHRHWAADCMARLQKYMIEDQIHIIRDQLKAAEASGRDVTELLQQFDEYQKHLKRVRPENFLIGS